MRQRQNLQHFSGFAKGEETSPEFRDLALCAQMDYDTG